MKYLALTMLIPLLLSCASTTDITPDPYYEELPPSFRAEEIIVKATEEVQAEESRAEEVTADEEVQVEENTTDEVAQAEETTADEAYPIVNKAKPVELIKETEYIETVRFIYLDKGKDRTRLDKNEVNSLLEENFQESIEGIESEEDFFNSIVEYTFIDGRIYDIVSSKNNVTDIRLEPGETIEGSVAIGQKDNWTLETTTSIENGVPIVHFLVRSEKDSGETTMIVPTNRRTYYFRLIATSGQSMLGCRFRYAIMDGNKIIGLSSPGVKRETQIEDKKSYLADITSLSFNYEIVSSSSWGPESVFSDGENTYFQFDPRFVNTQGAPALYLSLGNELSLINYRIKGNLYSTRNIIDNNSHFVFIKGNEQIEVFRR